MKIKLKDGTEFTAEYRDPGDIIIPVESYAAIETVVSKLTRSNLAYVVIQPDNGDPATYVDMDLITLQLRIIPDADGLKVGFGLRPLTREEKWEESVSTAASYLSDEQALTVRDLYPAWESLISQTVDPGTRFTYGDALYKVITPDSLLIQSQWIPGHGTSAIYSQISAGQAGTLEDPIDVPSDVTTNAFAYIVGKYYRWNGQIYKCQRDGEPDGTEHSFAYSPDQLLGQYFVAV